jgi:hypothetical protein
VLPVQGCSLSGDLDELALDIRDGRQEINVACSPGDAVELRDHKAATAVEVDILMRRVQFPRKKISTALAAAQSVA